MFKALPQIFFLVVIHINYVVTDLDHAVIMDSLLGNRMINCDMPFKWESRQETAFVRLKFKIARQFLETHPDFTIPFYVQTDASNFGIGGFIYQVHFSETNKPIPYLMSMCSRLLKKKKQKKDTLCMKKNFWPSYLLYQKTIFICIYMKNHSSNRSWGTDLAKGRKTIC